MLIITNVVSSEKLGKFNTVNQWVIKRGGENKFQIVA
jgi:hypothetical protein